MEASLRFAGPETIESKIFCAALGVAKTGFFRDLCNAVGEKGALKLYGTGRRPEFDPEESLMAVNYSESYPTREFSPKIADMAAARSKTAAWFFAMVNEMVGGFRGGRLHKWRPLSVYAKGWATLRLPQMPIKGGGYFSAKPVADRESRRRA